MTTISQIKSSQNNSHFEEIHSIIEFFNQQSQMLEKHSLSIFEEDRFTSEKQQNPNHQDLERIKEIEQLNHIFVTKAKLVFQYYQQLECQLKARILELAAENQKLQENIQIFKENVDALHKNVKMWENQYQNLKAQNNFFQEKLDSEIKFHISQKNQLKKTFTIVTENSAADLEYMENLEEEKESILEKIQSEKKIKQEIQEELQEIKQKYQKNQKILSESNVKLIIQHERFLGIEGELEEKIKIIERLTKDIEELKANKSQIKIINDENNKKEQTYENNLTLQKRLTFKDMHNLSDQIQYIHLNADYEEFERKSFILDELRIEDVKMSEASKKSSCDNINKSEIIQENSIDGINLSQKKAKPIQPDLYFAHFILTSQSTKIKLNSEAVLQIDVKPYYREIIQERVPMHLWEEWIRKKILKCQDNLEIQ